MCPLKVGIVGCGIGGLSIAHVLSNQGHDIHLFEKQPRSQPAGAGILLSANAMTVMQDLGLYDALVAAGAPIQKIETSSWQGKRLSRVNTMSIAHGIDSTSIGIHRYQLHNILMRKLAQENRITFDFHLQRIQQTDEKVILYDQDRLEYAFDLVIGADGIHSQTREMVFGKSELRNHHQICWRGVLDHANLSSLERNQLKETWGIGRKFGFLNISDAQTYWYAVLNQSIVDFETDDYTELAQRFATAHGSLQEIITQTPEDSISALPLVDKPPADRWHTERVVLLGDAINATTPNLGQGAAMAIESSWVLGECLQEHSLLEQALVAYQEIRKPRTDRVTSRSQSIGHISMLEHRLGSLARNLLSLSLPHAIHNKLYRDFLRQAPMYSSAR